MANEYDFLYGEQMPLDGDFSFGIEEDFSSVPMPEYGGLRTPSAPVLPPTMKQRANWMLNDILSDQNILRGMGEAGAAISSGQPIGDAFGQFGTNLGRRRAVQKAGQEQMNRNRTFQERMMEMFVNGKLLGPKDDNTTADSFSMDGDNNLTIKAGFASQPTKILGEQTRLEAYDRPNRGSSLPGFHLPSLV